ncbi:hypothetical protein RclHR1_02630003 [Rhizophagus clarus]|uniref:Kinase-like domain-containing protein n=1 Tax=Rhizophagus clarus TaxID=94130 RepID=A0A2Z6RV50_9GLOM|nr:hypothetical protein RclHR1_02630003 [Rhizophagus clarus]GET03543.1 kinase-like domain-containing protein [Rhizophagus clarus]
MSKKALLALEDGEFVKQYLKDNKNSYECLALIRKLTQNKAHTYARFTARHIYHHYKNHLNPRLCHDPLTHDEINFIIEQAQNQQRSKVIDWKFIIRDLEKKFGKLRSIIKIRDFWHSWNLDPSLYYDKECHDPIGDDEKKFIIRRVPKYLNSHMIWESVIRDLKNKFGKLRSADKIKMIWYLRPNKILDLDLCPDSIDEKIFIIKKHRTSNGTIWKYALRDLENKFGKFNPKNIVWNSRNKDERRFKTDDTHNYCSQYLQKYTSEEKYCNNCSADEPTKCEKYHFNYYGVCPNCKKINTGYAWCKKCDPGKFLTDGKSSGDVEIDQLIYQAQIKTQSYYSNLEWISYDRFKDIKLVAEGGFAEIYSATWLDGEPKLSREKLRSPPITIALKRIKDAKFTTEAFINEINIHHQCVLHEANLTKFYGLTKDPEKNEFLMILEYAHNGNLRDYLKNNFINLKWKDKLNILQSIANNLFNIHKLNYIHRDLHSGNILQFYVGGFGTKITDLGLSQSITNSKSSHRSNVFGVLPYIAPEIIDGKPYTMESDIYSFGIIMTEVSTGKPPYRNKPHDLNLAFNICNGLRPRVAEGTPKCYINLINQCLDVNPEKRPSSKELLKTIRNWQFPNEDYPRLEKSFKEPKISKEFINADNIFFKKSSPEIAMHSEAIYTSRSMCFYNLPEPRNSTGVQIEDPAVPDSHLVDLHISDRSFNIIV